MKSRVSLNKFEWLFGTVMWQMDVVDNSAWSGDHCVCMNVVALELGDVGCTVARKLPMLKVGQLIR